MTSATEFRYVRLLLDRAQAPSEVENPGIRVYPPRDIFRETPSWYPVRRKVNIPSKSGISIGDLDEPQRQTRNFLRHAPLTNRDPRCMPDLCSSCTGYASNCLHDPFPDKLPSSLTFLIADRADPPDVKLHHIKGWLEEEQRTFAEYDAASSRRQVDYLCYWISLLSLLDRKHPDLPGVHYMLAIKYLELAMPQDAIAHATEAMEGSVDFKARVELLIGICYHVMGNGKEAVAHVNNAMKTHKVHGQCSEEHPSTLPFHFTLAILNFHQRDFVACDSHLEMCSALVPHSTVTEADVMDLCMFIVKGHCYSVCLKILKLMRLVEKFAKKGQYMVRDLNSEEAVAQKLEKGIDLGPAVEVRVLETKQQLDMIEEEIRQHVDVVDVEVQQISARVEAKFNVLLNYFSKTATVRCAHDVCLLAYLVGCIAWLNEDKRKAHYALTFASDIAQATYGKFSTHHLTMIKFRAQLLMGRSFKEVIKMYEMPFALPPLSHTPPVEMTEESFITTIREAMGGLLRSEPKHVRIPDYTTVVADLSAIVAAFNQSTASTPLQVEHGHTLMALIEAVEQTSGADAPSGPALEPLLTSASQLFMQLYGEEHRYTKCVLKKLHKRLRPVSKPTFSTEVKTIRYDSTLMILCGTEGASVYFRWVGSENGQNWQKYQGIVRPPGIGKQTLESKAVRKGMLDSPLESKQFFVFA